ELIDPVIQRERLTAQSEAAAAGDEEAMQLDHDFLRALEYGAPPTGGLGMGIDRLVMLLTGTGIRETILFPLLKPEGDESEVAWVGVGITVKSELHLSGCFVSFV